MYRGFSLIVCCILFVACGDQHFIEDKNYRVVVKRDFAVKKKLLQDASGNLFAIFDAPMNLMEREAMEFLYAYSPIVDLSMYSGDFFLRHVRSSFRAWEEMPWGKQIPSNVFRHFVLPIRGGKENLDTARLVFYDELKERVSKCSSMEEAALEVNHWCHEHVIYRPTNARTFSPLATRKTAYGRCGEESVFTLAALRAVAIPARQIYTPRWAHCDDNHAWIEVWVDGVWKYLGACEPEPRLNMAWFSLPVQQALYVETAVFGKYEGDEELVYTDRLSSKINVTAYYTDTERTVVQVVDSAGKPVEYAKVEYRIFNYGEYFPVLKLWSDKSGKTRVTLGRGDLLVWASKGNYFGFRELEVAREDSIVVVLDKCLPINFSEKFDLIPPELRDITFQVSDKERAVNDRRFQQEDSLRKSYESTFMTSGKARELAKELGVDEDKFERFIVNSRGNYDEIVAFVRGVKSEQRGMAMDLLEVVAEKDLQDTPAQVFMSHLLGAEKYKEYPLFKNFILNPRVSRELLTDYRGVLEVYLHEKQIHTVSDLLEDAERLSVVDSLYTAKVVTPPDGVARTRVTDARSKNIFLVAACRTMGIPARLNTISGFPEYYDHGDWIPMRSDVVQRGDVNRQGYLRINYRGNQVVDPKYYLNFTVAKFTDDGMRTIDLGSNAAVDMGAGVSWSSIFMKPVILDTGYYTLSTGNRGSDGSVKAGIVAFEIKPGQKTDVWMELQDVMEQKQILGKIDNIKLRYRSPEGEQTMLALPEKGYTTLAIIGVNQEPTNHLLRDISAMKVDFEQLGVPMTFLFQSKEQLEQFSVHDFRPFPVVLNWGYDERGEISKRVSEAMTLKNTEHLPLVVVFDRSGNVVFLSQGYRVGLGTQLLKMMRL